MTGLSAHWPDLMGLAFLVFFSYRGYHGGFFAAVFNVVSLAVGCAAIMLLSTPFGDYLHAHEISNERAAYSAGSLLAFVAAYAGVWALSGFVQRLPGVRSRSRFPRASRFAGAIVGMGTGAFYAAFVIWIVLSIRAAGGKPPGSTIGERATRKIVSVLSSVERVPDRALPAPRRQSRGGAVLGASRPASSAKAKAAGESGPPARKGPRDRPDPEVFPAGGALLSDEKFRKDLSTAIKDLPGRQ